jgi:hypothetical protein
MDVWQGGGFYFLLWGEPGLRWVVLVGLVVVVFFAVGWGACRSRVKPAPESASMAAFRYFRTLRRPITPKTACRVPGFATDSLSAWTGADALFGLQWSVGTATI